MDASFEDFIAEAEVAHIEGWDFSWLAGHAAEERPPWRYAHMLGQRLSAIEASLDIQTGGEVLAHVPAVPRLVVATGSFPPNVAKATELPHSRGVTVVADRDEPPLPFGDCAFDLVTSRHPATIW
ncbi:hypothetical protein [Rothia uropygioeca]|uniref:hypothetical protein n=1 Tax=Kocuria sp. 257 TaxID=2021970 RepID=UPI0010115D93|nr:hypothetical protein [Kocuria sp. 257]